MRCLWIGRDCTYPTDSGDAIYSSRLLESFRDAGADVSVLARRRAGGPQPALPAGIDWQLVDSKTRRGSGSLLTRSPNIGHRHNTTSMRLALAEALDRGEWDVVLLDHLGAAWALPQLRVHRVREPFRLVYLSQNHERSTREQVARNAPGNALARRVLRFDARKAGALELAVVDAADLVTTVTEEDAALFRADAPDTPTLVLLPGYADRVVEARTITADLPRRAVIVGSFDWVAKRMNLEELLAVADPRFAEAGAELLVVGRGPEDWLDAMRRRSRATILTGYVDSVVEHLDHARIGIVAERSGGGFKLKVLHYVFNRVPVAALDGSLAGVPLVDGVSDIEAPTLEALTDAVLTAMDDLDRLNALQASAFDACRPAFDWSARGAALYGTLRNLA